LEEIILPQRAVGLVPFGGRVNFFLEGIKLKEGNSFLSNSFLVAKGSLTLRKVFRKGGLLWGLINFRGRVRKRKEGLWGTSFHY